MQSAAPVFNPMGDNLNIKINEIKGSEQKLANEEQNNYLKGLYQQVLDRFNKIYCKKGFQTTG